MTKLNPIHYRRDSCRLCNSTAVECVFEFEPSALAESYLPRERAHEAAELFPLDLFLCHNCGHVQLLDVIDPVHLFANYVYTSDSSPGLANHFRAYATHVVRKLGLAPGAHVVDVGSNDGTLLRQLADCGLNVLGIDPARGIAHEATAAGVPTINSFLNEAAVDEVRRRIGHAQLVTANNVFAHNDDLSSMADAVCAMLADDGVFVFEVSNLLDTVQGLVFDFVYHEHLCYHSVKPIRAFLRRHGLELFDVERVASKGGSLRGYAQKLNGPRRVSQRVDDYVAMEQSAGLYDSRKYAQLYAQVEKLREQTVARLQRCRAAGLTVAGYGASATVTTLMHHFQIGNLIDFLVDDNPIRHGTVSPGFGVPVHAPAALYEEQADVLIILAWRFADAIVAKHLAYLREGGTILVPVPVFREIAGRPSTHVSKRLKDAA